MLPEIILITAFLLACLTPLWAMMGLGRHLLCQQSQVDSTWGRLDNGQLVREAAQTREKGATHRTLGDVKPPVGRFESGKLAF